MPLPIDPSNGKTIIIGYYASIPAAIVGIAVFGVLTFLLFFRWIRARGRYMLWVTLGALVMTIGFVFRIPMHGNPTSIPVYTVQTLLILLSPCAFIAQDYYVLPHLAIWLDAPDCLLLKAHFVGRVFLISDCITFVVQLAGSAMSASATLATTGETIALIGLVVQLISFGLYVCLWAWFGFSVKRRHPRKWSKAPEHGSTLRLGWQSDWRSIYWAIGWTCIGILIRCVYRVVEFAQGYDGYLRTTEWCFYVLDSLPLACAIAVWVVVWPPFVLDSSRQQFGYNPETIRMAPTTGSAPGSTLSTPSYSKP